MKINSEAIRLSMAGELPKQRKRLVWRWWKCVPLVVMMITLSVLAVAIPWAYLLKELVP